MSRSASDSAGLGASLRHYALLAAAMVMAAGLTALVGWALDAAWLKGLVPGQVSMKANAAAAAVLANVALALLVATGAQWRRNTVARVRTFRRLHRAQEFAGNGFGLAVVYQIERHHGGRVWKEAEPGRSASFRFTLGEAAGYVA